MQDEKKVCEASNIIDISGKRELLTLPDLIELRGTPWKYVFIQSTSRLQMLHKGTHFMFCKI